MEFLKGVLSEETYSKLEAELKIKPGKKTLAEWYEYWASIRDIKNTT